MHSFVLETSFETFYLSTTDYLLMTKKKIVDNLNFYYHLWKSNTVIIKAIILLIISDIIIFTFIDFHYLLFNIIS